MRIPNHIGIIPDGNRRWALKHGLQKQDGYHFGLEPGVRILKQAEAFGINEITFYGFTVDNCKRPHIQQEAFTKACVDAVNIISSEGASLLVIGNTDSPCFPEKLLPYTRRTDICGGGIKLNFLVNYGWEWDLSGALKAKNAHSIRKNLYSNDISDIDLVIRWGGMRRLSGFLPVQTVYSDFYVVDALWPDFEASQFNDAMNWYNSQDVTRGG